MSTTILCGHLDPSGPNASALELARWLRRHDTGGVDTVGLWGGSWTPAFSAIAPTWVVNATDGAEPSHGLVPLDLGRAAGSAARPTLGIDRVVQGAARVVRIANLARSSDLLRAVALRRRLNASDGPVWLAGAGAARLLHYLPPCRHVVAHLGAHDPRLEETVADPDDLALLIGRPDHWVAGSEVAVQQLREAGVTARISVLPDLLLLDHDVATGTDVRSTYGIPDDAPLVMGYGEQDWWDVPDLFVQVAWELVHRRGAGVQLVWVGGGATESMLWPLRHDRAHAGLAGRLHVAPGGRPEPLLRQADIIAITGRSSLGGGQVRELTALGVPLARFVAGGEQPGLDGGCFLVPFLDDRAMADAILTLLRDHTVADAARASAQTVRARHRTDVIAPQLVSLLHGGQ